MKRAKEILDDAPKRVRKEWKGIDLASVRSSQLAEYYQKDDPVAVQLVDDAARALGAAVGGVVNFLSPEVIVIGGGVTGALGDTFIERIWEIAQRYTLPGAAAGIRCVPAALGDDSGIVGCAAYAQGPPAPGAVVPASRRERLVQPPLAGRRWRLHEPRLAHPLRSGRRGRPQGRRPRPHLLRDPRSRSSRRPTTAPSRSPTARPRSSSARWSRKHFPDDGFLGEEFGDQPGTSGFRWVIDPIDGTKSFVRHIPLWATLIGLEYQGEQIGGVAYIPVFGMTYRALRGDGAFVNERQDPRLGRRDARRVADLLFEHQLVHAGRPREDVPRTGEPHRRGNAGTATSTGSCWSPRGRPT